jgi:hypothetical protein
LLDWVKKFARAFAEEENAREEENA